MNSIKKAALTLTVLFSLAPAAPLYAQGLNDELCRQTPDATFCQEDKESKGDTPTSNTLYGQDGLITKVIGILSIVVGVVSVIMVIIGGLRYVMSSGDPNGANAAKNTILYALIGASVAILAQAIVVFVIGRL